MLDVHTDDKVTINQSRFTTGMKDMVKQYKQVESDCRLLKIGFVTLSEYLFFLRAASEAMSRYNNRVMFYLAAAVSDFYIPQQEIVEHKIQSSTHDFQLRMHPTPKMLSPLVKEWAPHAFVVSFKLETDETIISRKAKEALEKYKHQVVIANILQTRRKTVVLITPTDEVGKYYLVILDQYEDFTFVRSFIFHISGINRTQRGEKL